MQSCCKMKKNTNIDRWWDGRLITAKRAPEPTDIYWENVAFTWEKRFTRKLFTYIVSFILICFTFSVPAVVNSFMNHLEDDSEDNNELHNIVRLISFFKSLFISLINIILKKIVEALSSREKHESKAGYDISVVTKLVLFMFTNTALVTLTTHWGKDDWFTSGGVVVDIYSHMIVYNFIIQILYFVDVGYVIDRFNLF